MSYRFSYYYVKYDLNDIFLKDLLKKIDKKR